MDVRNGRSLHCDLRGVVAGAQIRAVPAPFVITRQDFSNLCTLLNHPNLPIHGGISACIAASARRPFFLDWIAAKGSFQPSRLESCY